jgi:acetyltransferase-like isoleucine patch superfamily enzyme
MRKISGTQILAFFGMLLIVLVLATAATAWLLAGLPFGDFRGVILTIAWLIFVYIFSIVIYRFFVHTFPLKAGEIEPNSEQEFIYHVYILFYLILFYPIMRSGFVPTPLMRLFYLALGTRLGENTYSQGIIHDPPFVQVGDNSVVGQYAILVPHVIEGSRLAHYPIKIGNNVTIGAHSSVLGGVEIGDDAVVATGSVVKKDTRIGPGEIWGGVPAKRIR